MSQSKRKKKNCKTFTLCACGINKVRQYGSRKTIFCNRDCYKKCETFHRKLGRLLWGRKFKIEFLDENDGIKIIEPPM